LLTFAIISINTGGNIGHNEQAQQDANHERSLFYIAGSNIRQNFEEEASNARAAAAAAVTERVLQQQISDAGNGGSNPKTRPEKHPDIGSAIESFGIRMSGNEQTTSKLLSLCEQSLRQNQENQPNRHDSPHTKNGKRMKSINEWQDAIKRLRQEKKELMDDGEDTADITARIKRYQSGIRKLEDEMFDSL
jgi:hypothetical protein